MHIKIYAKRRRAMSTLAIFAAALVASCGGAETEPFIPHGYPPPDAIEFQLRYVAPAGSGEPAILSVQPTAFNYGIASRGVATVEFVLLGRDVQVLTQSSTDASTGKIHYDFKLPTDFLLGTYSCHESVSIVRVTDRFGGVLSQSIELCPGPSVDFPPVYGAFV